MATISEALQLALEHHQAGRLQQAEQVYRQILQVDARQADALHLLGVIAHQSGQYDLAIDWISKAIASNPSNPACHNNLGEAYRAKHRLPEAMAAYQQALRLNPAYGDPHNNLGNVLRDLDRLAEAAASYQQCLRLKPGFVLAHHNLGNVFAELGQLSQAVASYQDAVRLRPDFAEAHFNLGNALADLGRLPEAAASYQEALRLRLDLLEAHLNLCDLLHDQDRPAEAAAAWEQLLARAPTDGFKVKAALAVSQILPPLDAMRRQRRQVEANVARLLQEELSLQDPLREVGSTNFHLAYQGHNDRDLQAAIAALYLQAAPSLKYVAPHCRPGAKARSTGDPLRVGFVSSFFHMHTCGEFYAGIIRNLPRTNLRVLLFRFPGPDDELARFIDQSADTVIRLPPDLAAARQQVAQQQLDALIYTDIGMDPITYFLAFSRLAPVQCTTLGHPVTTGIPALDYFISSADMEPLDADGHYTEKLVRLKSVPTFYYAPSLWPPPKTRRDFGLDEKAHIYLCPQAPFKIHPEYDTVLAEILRADPQGRVLFVRSHKPEWTRLLLRRLRRTIPDVVNRIGFFPHQRTPDYLKLIAACDVLLDTFPFGGGVTSYKAFTVGTPIVTLPGEFARNRMTYACYRKMGVLDCVARDRNEYVRIAVRLATDRAWQQEVRSKILAARPVIYEDGEVVRELERFLVAAVAQVRSSQAEG
jgi:predicted O-linked N-acetylglucosamine transferase (SPINDLY family)